jgi:hypothetical protein
MTLRTTLRLKYTSPETRLGADLADPVDGCKHESIEDYWRVHNAWWAKYSATLPPCRAPRDPVPVLLDERGVVVALLLPEALNRVRPLVPSNEREGPK